MSVDYRRLEFTGAMFTCINEWLPTAALAALERAIASSLARRVREFAKRAEKAAASFVPRHASDVSARSVETLISTAEFAELHAAVTPIIAKVGRRAEILNQRLFFSLNDFFI